jgi:hypothetical protein
MRMISASSALALVFALSSAASADDRHDGRDRSDTSLTTGFSDIAFGTRDGYWDNAHRWHKWDNDRDYQAYRTYEGANFGDWNHDRDDDSGLLRH